MFLARFARMSKKLAIATSAKYVMSNVQRACLQSNQRPAQQSNNDR